MKNTSKKAVSVVMPLELYETIKSLAEEDVRSIPSYIRLVLSEHVKQKNSVPPQRDGIL